MYMRAIDPSNLPQPGRREREAANDDNREGRQLELPGTPARRAKRRRPNPGDRAGINIPEAIKRKETGHGLKLMTKIQAAHPGDPLRQVDELIEATNIQAATGREREASRKTYKAYKDRMRKSVQDLGAVNMRIQNLSQLGRAHVEALVHHWEAQGASVSYMQNCLSTLRRVLIWLGKPDAVPRLKFLTRDPENASRTYAAVRPKTLAAKGIDRETLLQQMDRLCLVAGLQLRLMLAFGLRVEEAVMMRPQIADRGLHLEISYGTKGGRSRSVPIATIEQRELIERAKVVAAGNSKGILTAAPRLSLSKAKRHFYYLCEKVGLTNAQLGTTAHGLRHEFACETYKSLTGAEPPVLGGGPVEPARDIPARLVVVERMGHSRKYASTAYLGTQQSMDRFREQNLRDLAAMFRDEPVRKALADAGITRLLVLGEAAEGSDLGLRVLLAWEGIQPSVAHAHNAVLLHALVTALGGRQVALVAIGDPAFTQWPTFEVF
jgi:integrase